MKQTLTSQLLCLQHFYQNMANSFKFICTTTKIGKKKTRIKECINSFHVHYTTIQFQLIIRMTKIMKYIVARDKINIDKEFHPLKANSSPLVRRKERM